MGTAQFRHFVFSLFMCHLRAANNERLFQWSARITSCQARPLARPESLGTGQPRFSCIPQRIRRYSLSLKPDCESGALMARASRSVDLTQVTEWNDGTAARKDDFLAAEEPLEIRIGENPLSVTMRTPGHDLELAAGFLFTEGLVQRREQIIALDNVTSDDDGKRGNVVRAELSSEALPDFDKLRRHFFAASSCGICGKASIDAVRSRLLRTPNPDFRVEPNLIVSLPEALRSAQDVFERTGGLHAAALFDSGGNFIDRSRGYWTAQRGG